jgi:hypothetical protein
MRRCALVLAAGLAASGMPHGVAATPPKSTSLPGIGVRDSRVPVDGNAAPWNAIARVQISGTARCTAVLVGDRTALTAAHCLYAARLGSFVPAKSVHVLTGYAFGRAARHTVAAAYQVAPNYDPKQGDVTRGLDVATLTFAAPVVPEGTALSLAARPPVGTRRRTGRSGASSIGPVTPIIVHLLCTSPPARVCRTQPARVTCRVCLHKPSTSVRFAL